MLEALNLISAAVRRELTARVKISDPEQIRLDRDARLLLEQLDNPNTADDAASQLLDWLNLRLQDHV
jgi:hypothetical protein